MSADNSQRPAAEGEIHFPVWFIAEEGLLGDADKTLFEELVRAGRKNGTILPRMVIANQRATMEGVELDLRRSTLEEGGEER
ncbi:hypothetical protein [Microbispora sp. NPDC049125]|uniref:hypothetical protein n=1 Tax=Microbispora sp. NPDC049125 TaxID=3154929 RepID=UPI00346791EA